MDTLDDKVITRFWKRVEKSDGCWLWKNKPSGDGYGKMGIGAKEIKAHRLSYLIHYGDIPDGLWVLHTCDVRTCVRPDHLFLGTYLDNIADMVGKNRHWMAIPHPEHLETMQRRLQEHPELRARGERHGSRTHPERVQRGDQHASHRYPERRPRGAQHWMNQRPEQILRGADHPRAKLTEQQVREIRRRHALAPRGKRGIRLELAQQFHVSPYTIKAIIDRRLWGHIPDAPSETGAQADKELPGEDGQMALWID